MGEELDIKGTELLEITLDNDAAQQPAKILVHEGGTSSSKTVSIAQAHIVWSFQEYGKTYSVVRKTLPAMRKGALKDFTDALAWCGAESCFSYLERDNSYTNTLTGTRIEFFSLDDPQKARGPRRDRLWLNEANELTQEDWKQLAKRTRGRIVLDYNPSMQRHWLYDTVLTRPDCRRIHSTYLSNPYLTEDNIAEIEQDVPVYLLPADEQRAFAVAGLPVADGLYTDWLGTYEGQGQLMSGDPFAWAVFGLGQRGAPGEAIYPQLFDSDGLTLGRQRNFGLDFGFNHPMSLTEVEYRDRPGKAELHIDQLIHESGLTNNDLIAKLPGLGVGKRDLITADSAAPSDIEDIKRAGYNIVAADKGPGSVKAGIDKLKTVKLCFTRHSTQARAQFQDYRWMKTANGEVLDKPVKIEDDAPDSVRYAAAKLIRDKLAPRRRSSLPTVLRS